MTSAEDLMVWWIALSAADRREHAGHAIEMILRLLYEREQKDAEIEALKERIGQMGG